MTPPLHAIDRARVARYKRIMNRDPNELAKYDAALTALAAASARDRDDEADIDKATAALNRICRRREAKPNATAKELASFDLPRVDGMTPDSIGSEYKGMSISEAATSYLKKVGQPVRCVALVEAILANGFESTAERPQAALNTALERRALNYKDVVKIAHGLWVHADHMTHKQKAAIDHKARTARGMAQAKSQGRAIGQPVKISEDMAIKLKALLKAGATTREAAKAVGISHSTFYNWSKALDNWTEGQPWPPIQAASRKAKKTQDELEPDDPDRVVN